MSLGVFVTYVLERTCRPALVSEFGGAFSLGKLLRPGTGAPPRSFTDEMRPFLLLLGSLHRNGPVLG